jgi:hypothetical protein
MVPHCSYRRAAGMTTQPVCACGKSRTCSDVSQTTGKKLQRGFCQFVLRPIYKVVRACLGGPKKRQVLFEKYLGQLEIVLEEDKKALAGEDLFKCIMPKWLPLDRVENPSPFLL